MKRQCSEVQEALQRTWADSELLPFLGGKGGEEDWLASLSREDCILRRTLQLSGNEWITEHLGSCPECRGEVSSLDGIDRKLLKGFETLDGLVGAVPEERLAETLRRLREESPEVLLIRRIRRPLRIILWGVFFAFTLLASCLLAVALYRALRELL